MTLYDFLSGAVALGFFVCALFFLSFWRRTRALRRRRESFRLLDGGAVR